MFYQFYTTCGCHFQTCLLRGVSTQSWIHFFLSGLIASVVYLSWSKLTCVSIVWDISSDNTRFFFYLIFYLYHNYGNVREAYIRASEQSLKSSKLSQKLGWQAYNFQWISHYSWIAKMTYKFYTAFLMRKI